MDGGAQLPRRGAHRRLASPQRVMDHLPALVGFVDRDLCFRWVNQAVCHFYGQSRAEILGHTVPDIVGAAVFARVQPGIEAALGGEAVTFDDVAPDWYGPGVVGVSEERYVPRFGPTGAVTGFDFLSIEVTARRRIEGAEHALSCQLLLAQEEERRDLALELHEGICQALTGLSLWLASAEASDPHVAGAQRLLAGLTERTRRLAGDLRPPELEDFNLLLVLRGALRRFEQRTGIRVQFRAEGGGHYFPDPVQTAAYRIVEAALSNVEHHAAVREVAVALTVEAAVLTVTIRDEGPGFDPVRTEPGRGLGSMRIWAEAAGGSVIVEAAPGAGVAVTARLPVA